MSFLTDLPNSSYIVYDRGIHLERPGMSHIGKPEQITHLGRTTLPMNIIMDYLESLSQIYTAEVCTSTNQDLGILLTVCRPMISGRTTVIISRTISQLSFSEKAFQSISQTYRKQYLIVHLDA